MLPAEIFPGYTATATDITIPLSALPQLSAAEASAATGDGREVFRALLDAAYTNFQAIAEASRPKKMTMTKPAPTIAPGGAGMRQAYTSTFDVTPTALQMSPES